MHIFIVEFKIRSNELEKEKNRLLKKLAADYGFGIFGEIMFYIIVENICFSQAENFTI